MEQALDTLTVAPRDSFRLQAAYCRANDAPRTAAICEALTDALDDTTAIGVRVLAWPGNPVADALPLRLVGGLHALWRDGAAPALDPAYRDGAPVAPAALRALLAARETELMPWLDGPPQTNEPGRSAQLMAGLLAIAARYPSPPAAAGDWPPGERGEGNRPDDTSPPQLELLEIGSSAGLNLLIGHYRIELGPVAVGPPDSPVVLRPEWRGPPPPSLAPVIVSARGVDIAPVDALTPAGARRLLAYVWEDQRERFARLEAALALLRAHPPRLDAGDAPDWLAARLAEPQSAGVIRVLMHSIVWQYLGAERQARITALMEAAGARATPERPLAWVRVEADRTVHQHDITVRSWPGHAAPVLLGHAHAHGAWVSRSADTD